VRALAFCSAILRATNRSSDTSAISVLIASITTGAALWGEANAWSPLRRLSSSFTVGVIILFSVIWFLGLVSAYHK